MSLEIPHVAGKGEIRAENNDHPHLREYTFVPQSRGTLHRFRWIRIRASFPITKLDQTNSSDIRLSIRLTSLDTAR